MKFIKLLLFIIVLAFIVSCSSEDKKNTVTPPEDEPIEEPTLYGFWEMVNVDPLENKPISFGADSSCFYVINDHVYSYHYYTKNDTLIIFYPSFASFKYLLEENNLFLYSENDTLFYERPEPEATISIIFEFGYVVPEGNVEIIAISPSDRVERLISNRSVGVYSTQWFPDGNLENGPYAIDIYYDLNDTTWMMKRRYLQLER